jgi:hypothetical protein
MVLAAFLEVLFAFEALVVSLNLVLMVIHVAVAMCAKVATVLLLLAPHALHAILLLILLPIQTLEFQVSQFNTLNVKQSILNISMAPLTMAIQPAIFREASSFGTTMSLASSPVKAQ